MPILYRWLALIAAMAVSALFGAMEMHAHDVKRYDSLVANVKAEGEKAASHIAIVAAQRKEIDNATIKTYDTRLGALRKYYAGRVPNNSGCGQMSTVPATASAIDEGTANTLPSANTELIGQCAETTLQLETIQSWINQQITLDGPSKH